jgi:hypothetical protein
MNDPMDQPWTAADDAVEEVREIRRQISAEFDDDPIKLGEYYMELQKRHVDRVVYPPISSKKESRPDALSLVLECVSCRLDQLGEPDV